ncbi:quinone oxidoreductase family protein [Streptomyces sp. NPDC050759]|uniref:quinone oxidoreductase family protein n=1 Tax=Streptomyces sp. NPDC050759 TaxID=3365635 RepID=UPI0037AB66AA
MRAVRVAEYGGPEVFHVSDVPRPEPATGEVLIDVAYSGMNFLDVRNRVGRLSGTLPYTAGVECSGTVAAIGPGVTGLAPGARVCAVNVAGSHAEQVAADVRRVVPVPDDIPLETAAAALVQGLTGHYLTHDTYAVQPGDTVLVHAAAGGTGLMVTQFATLLGARVIGTVSTAEKEKIAREAGATEVLRYGEGLGAAVRALTDGRGVAAAYDGVGRATFDASLESLRARGVLILYGEPSGIVPPFDLTRLVDGGEVRRTVARRTDIGSLYVTRPSLVHHISGPGELHRRARAVFDAIRGGHLRAHIGQRYPLGDVVQAYRDLEERRTTGKSLLTL